MKPILISFNGNNINDTTNFIGKIPYNTPLQAVQAGTSFIKRAGATPVYSGKELSASYLTIIITCMGTLFNQLETINQWFNVYDEDPKQLIIKDTDDSDKQYSIYCTPRFVSARQGNTVTITLARKDPVWKSVTQNSVSWGITASGQTQAITNNGNIEAYPLFEFTPTTYPAGGYGYSRKILFYPTSLRAFSRRPVELLGGLDTAALVTATKAQADGDDFRILVDGVEVDRWFGDAGTSQFNQTATKCWIVLDSPAKREGTLKTAISNVGTPTKISYKYTTANKKAVTAMPNSGRVLINSEEFTYTRKKISSTVVELIGTITRATRNTSAASHSVGDTIRWIPFDIQAVYGDSAAVAPDIDNTYKPVINLATSTNSSFVYAGFQDTADPKGLRAGSWQSDIISVTDSLLSESDTYYGTNYGAITDPAEVMGMRISSYAKAGVYKADTATMQWKISIPDAVSNVDSNGEKYRVATQWFTTARLQSSVAGDDWVNEWAATEATPGSAATWTAWTHNSEAIPNTSRFLRYLCKGASLAVSGNYLAFEVTDVTLTLVNYPTTSVRSEEQGYYLSATITNTTTGDFITIYYPLQTNQTLYIDTDPNQPYAKLNGQVVNVVNPDANRSNWLPLNPGSNTLTFTTGTDSDITCVVKHYDRMNFV